MRFVQKNYAYNVSCHNSIVYKDLLDIILIKKPYLWAPADIPLTLAVKWELLFTRDTNGPLILLPLKRPD